jgi:hypothetical protein
MDGVFGGSPTQNPKPLNHNYHNKKGSYVLCLIIFLMFFKFVEVYLIFEFFSCIVQIVGSFFSHFFFVSHEAYGEYSQSKGWNQNFQEI